MGGQEDCDSGSVAHRIPACLHYTGDPLTHGGWFPAYQVTSAQFTHGENAMTTLNRRFRPLNNCVSHCELLSLGLVLYVIALLAWISIPAPHPLTRCKDQPSGLPSQRPAPDLGEVIRVNATHGHSWWPSCFPLVVPHCIQHAFFPSTMPTTKVIPTSLVFLLNSRLMFPLVL